MGLNAILRNLKGVSAIYQKKKIQLRIKDVTPYKSFKNKLSHRKMKEFIFKIIKKNREGK